MPKDASNYEIRPASTGSGACVVHRTNAQTVVFDRRALDGLSLRAAHDIFVLLERIDALRSERHRRVIGSNDLAAILELGANAIGPAE